jgi:hypothetical protein
VAHDFGHESTALQAVDSASRRSTPGAKTTVQLRSRQETEHLREYLEWEAEVALDEDPREEILRML